MYQIKVIKFILYNKYLVNFRIIRFLVKKLNIMGVLSYFVIFILKYFKIYSFMSTTKKQPASDKAFGEKLSKVVLDKLTRWETLLIII